MATIKFFIKHQSQKSKKKAVSIFCRLRAGRKVDMTVKSGIFVFPEHFNNHTGTLRNVVEARNRDQVNRTLQDLHYHILTELSNVQDKEDLTQDWLKNTIDAFWNPEKYKPKVYDLFTFIQDFIDKAPTRANPKSGRPVSYKMIREYNRTFHYLKEYAKEIKKEIDFKDIDLDFYYGFVSFLQNLNLSTNTIGKKIQTLKIFLNAATDMGYNTYQYYKSPRFKVISEESESIYLTQEELEKLYNLDLSNDPRLERVRDLFIVGCWTGVRFSDISQITSENIKDGFIHIKQTKTGGKVVIPVHHTVEAILKKYDGHLPRVITNQRFNEYLKEIAKRAGLNDRVHKTITKGGIKRSLVFKKWELVTTHTGRRSFATNNYLMGVPTVTIMAITGHKTEEAFLRYIKVTPQEHAEKIKRIWDNQLSLSILK